MSDLATWQLAALVFACGFFLKLGMNVADLFFAWLRKAWDAR